MPSHVSHGPGSNWTPCPALHRGSVSCNTPPWCLPLPRTRDPCCSGSIPCDCCSSACSHACYLLSADVANRASSSAPGFLHTTAVLPVPDRWQLPRLGLTTAVPTYWLFCPIYQFITHFFPPSSWAVFCSIILLGLPTYPAALPPTPPPICRHIQTGPARMRLPCRASVGTQVRSKTRLTPAKHHFYSSNSRVGFPGQVTLLHASASEVTVLWLFRWCVRDLAAAEPWATISQAALKSYTFHPPFLLK